MAYIVTANTGGKINLAPKTREEEILQNVRFLLSTPKFTVPLDRDFGLAQRFIDKPLPVAISIHALREERDKPPDVLPGVLVPFQSTRSARSATAKKHKTEESSL